MSIRRAAMLGMGLAAALALLPAQAEANGGHHRGHHGGGGWGGPHGGYGRGGFGHGGFGGYHGGPRAQHYQPRFYAPPAYYAPRAYYAPPTYYSQPGLRYLPDRHGSSFGHWGGARY